MRHADSLQDESPMGALPQTLRGRVAACSIVMLLVVASAAGQEEALRFARAYQSIDQFVDQHMREAGPPGVAMALTSRTQVDRLLDPKNDITLSSLQRATAMVGRRVTIELV
jgi:hypothetical protein